VFACGLHADLSSRARHLLGEDDTAQDRKHAKDAKEVERLRRNAGELRNVGVNSGSDLLQKMSMQLRDRAERLEQTLRPTHVERSGKIRLASRSTHARVLIALRDAVVQAPDGCALFSITKLDLRQDDRLVLLGRNGVGNSQLIAMLRLAVAQQVAGVRVSPGVVLGHAAQGMAHLPDGVTPHRTIAALPGRSDGRAASLLAGAGLGVDTHHKPTGPGVRCQFGRWSSGSALWRSPSPSRRFFGCGPSASSQRSGPAKANNDVRSVQQEFAT
jgi:ATPase subunit of ABC transporter with duplicated ATPase domains